VLASGDIQAAEEIFADPRREDEIRALAVVTPATFAFYIRTTLEEQQHLVQHPDQLAQRILQQHRPNTQSGVAGGFGTYADSFAGTQGTAADPGAYEPPLPLSTYSSLPAALGPPVPPPQPQAAPVLQEYMPDQTAIPAPSAQPDPGDADLDRIIAELLSRTANSTATGSRATTATPSTSSWSPPDITSA
jgi:hypothetical protein